MTERAKTEMVDGYNPNVSDPKPTSKKRKDWRSSKAEIRAVTKNLVRAVEGLTAIAEEAEGAEWILASLARSQVEGAIERLANMEGKAHE